jgi:DNA-binding beta-propeller fold protein YncE
VRFQFALLLGLLVARPADPALRLVQAIPLPGVNGRIDHLAFDSATRRLFVAALGNNTVEVLDVAKNRWLTRVDGFREPQGIAIATARESVAVANGEGDGISLLRREGFARETTVALGDDSDNVRYSPHDRRLYVGYASGFLAAIDETTAKVVGRAALEGHPESFQLNRDGTRAFVNVPTARHIAVVDLTTMRVLTTWPIRSAADNFPMALDESAGQVLVGCRHPATLLVLDIATGRQLDAVPIVGDTDDLFYDAARQRVYVTGGEGFVDVLERRDGRFTRTERIPTAAGARTSLFVPVEARLFVAVPHRGAQAAEIRVFAAGSN